MARGRVHTVHRDGQWVNEVEGSTGAPWSSDEDRERAVERGRNLARARRSVHVTHGRDGEETDRVYYGRTE